MRAGMILSAATCIVIGAALYPLSGLTMRLFSQSTAVIEAGITYLHSVLPFYVLLAAMFMISGVMRGAGEMIVPMICSFTSLWIARVPTAYLLAHFFGRDSIFYSYAIGWAIGLVIGLIYYLTGRWKNKSIIGASTKTPESENS